MSKSPSPPSLSRSDKRARESVAVTVYNQNFGVVRDTRRLNRRGRVELSFKDVSAHVQPETVRLQLGRADYVLELDAADYAVDLNG